MREGIWQSLLLWRGISGSGGPSLLRTIESPSIRYTATILLPSSRRGEEKEGIRLPIVDRRYSILILERGVDRIR